MEKEYKSSNVQKISHQKPKLICRCVAETQRYSDRESDHRAAVRAYSASGPSSVQSGSEAALELEVSKVMGISGLRGHVGSAL